MFKFKRLFTKPLFLLFSALSAFAQLPVSPIFNSQDQASFDAAYKASLPPEIVNYMALPYSADVATSANAQTRTTPALLNALASKYALDTQIMIWGWDPYMTDLIRINQGYAWVPSFGQTNIPVGPGIDGGVFNPPLPSYNPQAPAAGSISMPAVSADGKMALPAPFAPPVTVAPVITTDPVGFLEMPFGQPNGVGDWYSLVFGDKSPVGTVSQDSRGTFTKQYAGFANLAQPGVISVFWVKTK